MRINLFYKTNNKIFHPKDVKNIIRKILAFVFPKSYRRKELNFVFVNNKEIKKFNKEFLNKNCPTDTLCFSYNKNMADIIISTEEVVKNAKRYKTTPKEEFLFVLIHSILHFKGMKDNKYKERKRMFRYTFDILEKLKHFKTIK